MSHDSQQAITHVLQQDSKILDTLLCKLKQLKQLQAILTESLEAKLASHCLVANLENDCLIVITDSALWATQFRFQASQLLLKLRLHPQLFNLRNVECKIRPRNNQKSLDLALKPVQRISSATAQIILESCQNIAYAPLKNIMEKISRNIK